VQVREDRRGPAVLTAAVAQSDLQEDLTDARLDRFGRHDQTLGDRAVVEPSATSASTSRSRAVSSSIRASATARTTEPSATRGIDDTPARGNPLQRVDG
jgi:hypothetical protein